MSPMIRQRFLWIGLLCLALAACAGPVGATRADPKVIHKDLGRSAVTTGEPSLPTRNLLFERGLFEAFDANPEATIADLHRAMVASQGDPDLLFALAELSFLYGQTAAKPEYYLASAVYAYAFLFPDAAGGATPGRFDPRVRVAADLYNWALTSGFASDDKSEVILRGGTLILPFGTIDVAFDPEKLRVGSRELYKFVPVAELEVYGLAMRYRWPGIGAPLAASTRPVDASRPGTDIVAPRLQVPVTALLRIPDARRALTQGSLAGTLEIYFAWDAESVSIAGEQVPLENEPSAALAITFTGVPTFELETLGLLGRLSGLMKERPPLVSATPYRPGLIPVVFVHGTASSIVRWAEMYNRLQADPEIRSRFQFWFFQYDSGNPIALSALHLREALTTTVARLDPEGRDPALRQMVLIGHSQGGLLVKMQVISTGDQLWNAISRKPLEELQLSDQTRDLFRRGLFVEPLPMVSRVVFICTPHRGSYVAGRRILANLTRQLLTMPFALTGVAGEINRNPGAAKVGFVPTAVDNMSPGHPFIVGLQAIPVVPSVTVNSIIAVEGDGPVEQGDDGVVKYSAAHIEPVESELIVKSGHSTQGNPHTIEEVRRILALHAGVKTATVPAGR